jgi:AAA15 family ATPase/GTPase
MFRLLNITIENFRGIRQGSLTDFAEVNVLIGRNNSGKTTVLEAITRATRSQHDKLQPMRRETVDEFWNRMRNSGRESICNYNKDTGNLIKYQATVISNVDETASLVSGGGVISSQPLSQIFDQHIAKFRSGIAVFTPRMLSDQFIESVFWPELISNRRDKLLRNAVNETFDMNAEGLQLLPNGEFMVMFEKYSIPLDSMGDGTRAAMRAFMCLAMVSDTLFLMEEPECHQHPGSLELFAKGLCKLAKERRVQIILTTHSQECIRAFSKATQASESTFAVYHLSLNDGIQEARRLERDALETLDESGIDVRFADLYV